MKDINDLIKIVNDKIAVYSREVEIWEAIKEHLEDSRFDDEIGDKLKYG